MLILWILGGVLVLNNIFIARRSIGNNGVRIGIVGGSVGIVKEVFWY